jgi:hypothetical protein
MCEVDLDWWDELAESWLRCRGRRGKRKGGAGDGRPGDEAEASSG